MSIEAFQAGVYAAAFILCILFASIAARSAYTNRQYLVAFFLAEAFGVLCEWLLLLSDSSIRWLWLSLLMTCAFWTAPCLWHFAKSYSSHPGENAVKSSRPRTWEYALPLAGAALCIPLFMASNLFATPPAGSWLAKSIHPTMSLCVCLFVIQVVIYWSKTLQVFKQEQHAVKSFYASLTHPILGMFRVLLVLVVANWLASLIRAANVWFLDNSVEVGVIAVLVEYLIMLTGFFFLFHGNLPRPVPLIQAPNDEPAELKKEPSAPTTNTIKPENNPSQKYAKAALADTVTQRIVEKLHDRENILPLIRDNGISLDKLASHLGEKSYYISQVLNQELNTTFYEYVNALRISEVCRQLVAKPDQKIFDIALSLGFNSKSTFNTAFKHHQGMTPSSYRAEQVKRLNKAAV